MEWTITQHKFVGANDFILLTMDVKHEGYKDGTHAVLVEYNERAGLWEVRDACDSGTPSESLIKAIGSYVDKSRHNNASAIGHCEWMLKVGLPSIERNLGDIVKTIIGFQHQKAVMN